MQINIFIQSQVVRSNPMGDDSFLFSRSGNKTKYDVKSAIQENWSESAKNSVLALHSVWILCSFEIQREDIKKEKA